MGGGSLKVHSEDTSPLLRHVPKTSPHWFNRLTLVPAVFSHKGDVIRVTRVLFGAVGVE